ncbi:hypothetical protein Lal_00002926 [Lupinus albus]|nr:hypothetical protein Lal_00002926 [Lupinus albus]
MNVLWLKVEVTPTVDKMVESRLRWVGHMWRTLVKAHIRRRSCTGLEITEINILDSELEKLDGGRVVICAMVVHGVRDYRLSRILT